MTYAAAYTAIMKIVGMGIAKILPLPRTLNCSGNPQTGLPSVYMYDAPRQTVISASVTMNGVIANFVTNVPAIAPELMPMTTPEIAASGRSSAKGISNFNTLVVTTPVNATSAPTERSIPDVRITNVIPTAMIAVIDVCRETLRMFSDVKKYGERKENNTISARRAMVIPNLPATLRNLHALPR